MQEVEGQITAGMKGLFNAGGEVLNMSPWPGDETRPQPLAPHRASPRVSHGLALAPGAGGGSPSLPRLPTIPQGLAKMLAQPGTCRGGSPEGSAGGVEPGQWRRAGPRAVPVPCPGATPGAGPMRLGTGPAPRQDLLLLHQQPGCSSPSDGCSAPRDCSIIGLAQLHPQPCRAPPHPPAPCPGAATPLGQRCPTLPLSLHIAAVGWAHPVPPLHPIFPTGWMEPGTALVPGRAVPRRSLL